MAIAEAVILEDIATSDLNTVEAVVEECVQICMETGLTPSEAARRSPLLAALSAEDLLRLALVGLTRMVQGRLPKPSRSLGRQEKPSRDERRQVLYQRSRDALTSLFQGVDGQMKTLYQFTVEDHRYRLAECEKHSSGWRRSARFHQESLTAFKRDGVADCIAELDPGEQERLRRLL